MNILLEFECDLKFLNNFSQKLAKKTQIGDIFFLSGELGVGKTTFARFFINSLFEKENTIKPKSIKSPSFPIMLSYSLSQYEIFHYDLYRLKNKSELSEIDFFENYEKNLSIIEWPDLILKNFKLENYYIIQFDIIDDDKRLLIVKHSNKSKI